MLLFPNSKINFGLYIVAKRNDGYHNIESILWPVPWRDILEVVPAPDGKFQFTQTGIPLQITDENNLVVKVWIFMQERFDLSPVHIYLHKTIPSGAGLGGGSSDAAYTIKALNSLFSLKLSTKRMQSFAAKFGSDCPFFIDEKPHFVAGTGTLLAQTKLDLTGYHIGIIKPDISISSAEAYKNIELKSSPSHWENVTSYPYEWRHKVVNQFEEWLMLKNPELMQFKDKLYSHNAFYASLTGSGAAIYGLFEEAPRMNEWFPDMLTWQGQL